jgi:Holliday junction resolvase
MRESTIERAVCAYAKAKGCLVLKLAGPNQKGQPDSMFLRDGKVLFIEFKATGKRPTALQERFLRDLQLQNFNADWVDTVTDGCAMIEDIFP